MEPKLACPLGFLVPCRKYRLFLVCSCDSDTGMFAFTLLFKLLFFLEVELLFLLTANCKTLAFA